MIENKCTRKFLKKIRSCILATIKKTFSNIDNLIYTVEALCFILIHKVGLVLIKYTFLEHLKKGGERGSYTVAIALLAMRCSCVFLIFFGYP